MERRNGENDGLRCVLWHARGALVDPSLVQVLDQRGIAWKAWDSDLLAIAELCRTSDPGMANGAARIGHRTVFLLCEPARLDHLSDAMKAIERFRPAANVWVFDPSRTDKLAGLRPREVIERYAGASNGTPVSQSAAVAQATSSTAPSAPEDEVDDGPIAIRPRQDPPAPPPRVVRNAPPRLRLAGEGTLPPSVEDEVLNQPEEANLPAGMPRRNVAGMGAILTDEEVAMLLAAEDHTRRPPGVS